MRGILAVLLLLATVEGNPFWGKWKGPFQPPGHSFLPPGQSFQPPGHSFQPPGHSFQPHGPPFPFPGLGPGRHSEQNSYPGPQQPGIDLSNAAWVCTNPKTRDMIVITAIDGSQTVINGQTLPNGGCLNQSGCYDRNTNPPNTNCKEQNPNIENPQTAAPVTTDESIRVDTGEGIIEIRSGDE